MKRQSHFGLNLVLTEAIKTPDLQEDHRERNDGENKEKEDNVVAKKKVIRFISRIIEPNGFSESEISSREA